MSSSPPHFLRFCLGLYSCHKTLSRCSVCWTMHSWQFDFNPVMHKVGITKTNLPTVFHCVEWKAQARVRTSWDTPGWSNVLWSSSGLETLFPTLHFQWSRLYMAKVCQILPCFMNQDKQCVCWWGRSNLCAQGMTSRQWTASRSLFQTSTVGPVDQT